MAGKKTQEMEVIHVHAAGIDIGSRSHYVAIGQEKGDVKEFGVYSADHQEMIKWLIDHQVNTVAMESTGTYWQNLYADLQIAGFEVLLANGKFTKNIKGKKSDVLDCQWIQKLHALGLLSGSFLPDATTEQLRTYTRHRSNLVGSAASTTNKMQKYLRLMNLRLDVVVRDVTGLTGMKIIKAVCQGEECPQILASMRHGNCKKSKKEIQQALQSNGRKDYLFALQQELDIYITLQGKITLCDQEIKLFIDQHVEKRTKKEMETVPSKKQKKVNKNTPQGMDIQQIAFQHFGGVDLMEIEGVSHNTVMTIMSEIGAKGFGKFDTAKQFVSWLRLAPNNKISGGKILASQVQKGKNNVKIALRQAANVIGRLKDAHLYPFFVRIALRKSRVAAVTATARKLATIIFNMIVKKEAYKPNDLEEFLMQKRKRKLKEIRKNMQKFDISTDDLKFSFS